MSGVSLDCAQQRCHQPGVGRFMTPDSAPNANASDPGSMNKYAYVAGDPVNRVDQHGQDYCDGFDDSDFGCGGDFGGAFIYGDGGTYGDCGDDYLSNVPCSVSLGLAAYCPGTNILTFLPVPGDPSSANCGTTAPIVPVANVPCNPWVTTGIGSESADDINLAGRVADAEGGPLYSAATGYPMNGTAAMTGNPQEYVAIASVMYNRLNNPGFGNLGTLTAVVTATYTVRRRTYYQFNAYNGNQLFFDTGTLSSKTKNGNVIPWTAGSADCDNLTAAIQDVVSILQNGGTPYNYTYFGAAGSRDGGTQIGQTKFW